MKSLMKPYIYLWLFLGLLGCNISSKETKSDTNTAALPKPNDNCKKCDTLMFDHLKKDFDKLNKDDIEKFLCSFDQSCQWSNEQLQFITKERRYSGYAWDMLFMYFDKYFDEYIEVFEQNQAINRPYLLKLFSHPATYDLPHHQILAKLQRIKDKTPFQKTLLNTFEKQLQGNNKLIEKGIFGTWRVAKVTQGKQDLTVQFNQYRLVLGHTNGQNHFKLTKQDGTTLSGKWQYEQKFEGKGDLLTLTSTQEVLSFGRANANGWNSKLDYT